MKDITQEEWEKLTAEDKDAVILDVRTEEEVEEGVIPGATNIDIYQSGRFMEEINQMDKDKSYYVYCKSGGRSAQACAIMDQIGFQDTYNLIGGFSNWTGEKDNK